MLPWRDLEPGTGVEGRVVDVDAAREILEREEFTIAAVPVGGRPGPYKTWRFPLWSRETFSQIVELGRKPFLSLPWGSVLPKQDVKRYNAYGGGLPAVHSFPHGHLGEFVNAGAIKISFQSDGGLAFLCGLRESLLRRPEVIDASVHLEEARRQLTTFLKSRFRVLWP